jgi:hypothetical protein
METQALSSMNRRGFLRKAGLGAIALGSVPVLAETLATRAFADEETTTGFIFAAVSIAPTIDGAVHTLVMDGAGTITPSNVEGGGAFNHVNNASTAALPRPFFAQGTWKAKRLVSFDNRGQYGLFTAGVLTMDVELTRELPSRLVLPASLQIVCNIPFVPIRTGKPEGFSLTIDGLAFLPSGMGITLFPPGRGRE